MINKMCKWTEKLYDMKYEDILEYIESNSENGIVYIEYQYKQLGKDETWFKNVCRTVNNEPLKVRREILLQRLRGNNESPFESEDLDVINEYKKSVKEELFISKIFKFDIYETLKRDRAYLVGVDPSSGYGKDNCAITVIDPYTLEPVAEFKSPFIGFTKFRNLIYILIKKHVPRGILIIERNAGEALIDSFRNSDICHNLYFDKGRDMVDKGLDSSLDEYGMAKKEASQRRYWGVYTLGKSRDTMFSILARHVEEYKEKFVTNNIIDDLYGLVRKRTGRIEAGPGKHDDSIMSYLIALYVYYHGNNLHRFGFIKGELPDEESANRGMTYEEILEEAPLEVQREFKDAQFATKDYSDYMNNIQNEIARARSESMHIDRLLDPSNYSENLDEFEMNDHFDLSIFDDLN